MSLGFLRTKLGVCNSYDDVSYQIPSLEEDSAESKIWEIKF